MTKLNLVAKVSVIQLLGRLRQKGWINRFKLCLGYSVGSRAACPEILKRSMDQGCSVVECLSSTNKSLVQFLVGVLWVLGWSVENQYFSGRAKPSGAHNRCPEGTREPLCSE